MEEGAQSVSSTCAFGGRTITQRFHPAEARTRRCVAFEARRTRVRRRSNCRCAVRAILRGRRYVHGTCLAKVAGSVETRFKRVARDPQTPPPPPGGDCGELRGPKRSPPPGARSPEEVGGRQAGACCGAVPRAPGNMKKTEVHRGGRVMATLGAYPGQSPRFGTKPKQGPPAPSPGGRSVRRRINHTHRRAARPPRSPGGHTLAARVAPHLVTVRKSNVMKVLSTIPEANQPGSKTSRRRPRRPWKGAGPKGDGRTTVRRWRFLQKARLVARNNHRPTGSRVARPLWHRPGTPQGQGLSRTPSGRVRRP